MDYFKKCPNCRQYMIYKIVSPLQSRWICICGYSEAAESMKSDNQTTYTEVTRVTNVCNKNCRICKSLNIKTDSKKDLSGINDGWIPVEERLPEVFGKYWITIRYDDGRISEPIVADFRGVKRKYVVDTPNGREYETWGIDSAFHGSRVIAWRPYYIPESYRPERRDNHDRE